MTFLYHLLMSRSQRCSWLKPGLAQRGQSRRHLSLSKAAVVKIGDFTTCPEGAALLRAPHLHQRHAEHASELRTTMYFTD